MKNSRRQVSLCAVLVSLVNLAVTMNGVEAQFNPVGVRDPWGPRSFRGQFPSPFSGRMQELTARGSGRSPPIRQPNTWGSGRSPPIRQPNTWGSGRSPPIRQPNTWNQSPLGPGQFPRPGVNPMNQNIVPPASSNLNPENGPVPNQASGISAITSILLNNTSVLNSGTGNGLSPASILSQVQNLPFGSQNPAGSSNGLSQILNFGKTLLENALRERTPTNADISSGNPDVKLNENQSPQETIHSIATPNIKAPEIGSTFDKKEPAESKSAPIKSPTNQVLVSPKVISEPVNPSEVKTVKDSVKPLVSGSTDNTDLLKPTGPKLKHITGRGNSIEAIPLDTTQHKGNANVWPDGQLRDVIRPGDGLHSINPITGLPEFPHSKPISVVAPKEVVDKGHFHDDGTFHDFPVELHGRDRSNSGNSLSVLDPVTGEIAVFPDIGINSDSSHKTGDPTEIRAAWLMARKRAQRLREQNRRLRELLRQHMNEVHPSEIVPIGDISGLKPGDVIPIDVIPSFPDYIPSATASPTVKIPSDLGFPEPEPVIPGNPIDSVQPEPGDAIPFNDVIPEYIPSATASPIKVPNIRDKRPLQPGDVIPLDDVVPGYIPSATAAPEFIFPIKDKDTKHNGANPEVPVKPKLPDTFVLPATPAPVIRVPPTTRRPLPPPPPPRRPPPPPPQKKNNLLANLGIGFAIGSLLFGK
uniref:Uncharacterized protein n=1 Tax=Magallana gigas TaxID=29159 RepID=A0A8W8ILG4_MAGGI|nr:uncharacterized protein LOC105317079 [Crassostrea gigas]